MKWDALQMEANDIINIVFSAWKDKVTSECLIKIRQEYQCLLEADADVRRSKKKEAILEMARLRIALDKFCISYNRLKTKCGNIMAVEEMIKSVTERIEFCSKFKNSVLK